MLQKCYHIYILCVCVCVCESELEFVLGGNGGDWGTIACFSSDIRKTNPLFKDKHCCFLYTYI